MLNLYSSTSIDTKIKKDCQFSNAKRNFNWLNFGRKDTFHAVKFSVVKFSIVK